MNLKKLQQNQANKSIKKAKKLKKNNKYKIHLKKFEFQGSRQERLAELEKQYVEFLEDLTKKYPLQFYHFYDLFLE